MLFIIQDSTQYPPSTDILESSPLLVSGEEIIDLIRQGQGVLNVLPLAGVKQELDDAIIDLFPSAEDRVRLTG